ncbi:HEAT repeat domain-containing protein [Geothrix sp. 21YS21S-4]|uniref:HEAT repeat domain-containing protein n=1 Tax=Geothrix sp. 21YS21S-4 TaxID=3068889 RepID=UPI0027B959FA|nr:HEAT repeat domain-containing protein [Geothrix sp. 21YS21S-4]
MSDFLQLAQSLTLALKALQMYTAAHPRGQEALAASHAVLERWLADQEQFQVAVSGPKTFIDGVVQDARNPHVAALAKAVAERGVAGFTFERGVTVGEYLAFLQGLGTKPQKLEEAGGFEAFLRAADVRRIRISQVRYQEVREGEGNGEEDSNRPPALNVALPPKEDPLAKAIREALMAALGSQPSSAAASAEALRGFSPANLGGLGPLGYELGFGDGPPTQAQLGTLRQVLMGLEPEVQLSLLAGLGSLPDHPAGLGLAVKALAGELLAVAVSSALAKGISWLRLRGPVEDILRPLPDRDRLGHGLAAHLRGSGQEAGSLDLILRQLEWEALSVEAKLVKVLEEGQLFELSGDHLLAFLRDLLDLRRFDAFLRVQDVLMETLRHDRPDFRLKGAQALAGIARWAQEPGLPPGGEGPLAEALRAHFAWEPDPHIHRWTQEALEALFAASVNRGDLLHVLSDLQEVEGLCAFLQEDAPWRRQALEALRAGLAEPALLDAAVDAIFDPDRERVAREVFPYLEFLGAPMAQQLVARLERETERARRGRLVEALRNQGDLALSPITDALGAPTWFLVRNALTLLADLGDASSLPAIIPILRHPEPRVRRVAARALWKLGGPSAEPHLVARMKDTDPETLQEILFILGQLRSETSVPAVLELAQDKRVWEPLRVQALATLAQIASPQAQPILMELLRRGFFAAAEPPAIRLAAARALRAIATPAAQEALRRVVDAEPKGADRDALLEILGPVRS